MSQKCKIIRNNNILKLISQQQQTPHNNRYPSSKNHSRGDKIRIERFCDKSSRSQILLSSGENLFAYRYPVQTSPFRCSFQIIRHLSSSQFSTKHPSTNSHEDYKSALSLLSQLPSNLQTIRDIEKRLNERSKNVENTLYYLSLLGINGRDLNRLNVIHVAGTKGKGSTCAYVESILRENGYKTGFFSSPHLVMPRERIQIGGQMISEQKFADYLQHVFYMLKENSEIQLPAYFNFFCVMAFYIFVRERVDVAIMEVGIGGEYDSTNVVPKPICTGITSLDLDHCNILGTTLDQIAWHKAGIFKNGVPAFTVQQKTEAMEILKERSQEKDCPLFVVPQWSLYPYANHIKLGINGDVQKLNASLAVQLAHYWIRKRADSMYFVSKLLTPQGTFADVISLKTNDYIKGLENTKWYGRCERIPAGNITYFLDGAHTNDSMEACVKWFLEESYTKKPETNGNGNVSNDNHEGDFLDVKNNHSANGSTEARPVTPTSNGHTSGSGKHGVAAILSKIQHLHHNHHHHHHHHHHNNNQQNQQFEMQDTSTKAFRILVFNCTGNRDPSTFMAKLKFINFDLVIFTTNILYKDSDTAERLEREREIASNNTNIWTALGSKTPISRVDSIHNAIQLIESYQSKVHLPIHVLVTGSVYLVGGFIALVHPEFAQTSTKF